MGQHRQYFALGVGVFELIPTEDLCFCQDLHGVDGAGFLFGGVCVCGWVGVGVCGRGVGGGGGGGEG